MKAILLVIFFHLPLLLVAQSFEISGLHDNYRVEIGETIKAPLRLKNLSDKTLFLVIRKVGGEIGSTQRNYFCVDNNCLDSKTEDYAVKIEPLQSYSLLQIAVEGGLASATGSVKYLAFNKFNQNDFIEFELNFQVEEKVETDIYNSVSMVLHDVYPNPVSDYAIVDYRILNERLKAKIVIHNLLGNPIEEFALPYGENKVKLRADGLSPGIYFYTLHLDNEGVITRKLIVRK